MECDRANKGRVRKGQPAVLGPLKSETVNVEWHQWLPVTPIPGYFQHGLATRDKQKLDPSRVGVLPEAGLEEHWTGGSDEGEKLKW